MLCIYGVSSERDGTSSLVVRPIGFILIKYPVWRQILRRNWDERFNPEMRRGQSTSPVGFHDQESLTDATSTLTVFQELPPLSCLMPPEEKHYGRNAWLNNMWWLPFSLTVPTLLKHTDKQIKMCRGDSASQGALVSVAVPHKSLPIYDAFVGKPDTLILCIFF